jgi:hypothetical protein
MIKSTLKKSISLNTPSRDFNPNNSSSLNNRKELQSLFNRISWLPCFLNLHLIVRNDPILIVWYDSGHTGVVLDHLLMMTSTLYGVSRSELFCHEGEHLALASAVLSFKHHDVFFNELNVFEGLVEVPHPKLLVSFFLMTLTNPLVFLLSYEDKRATGSFVFSLRSWAHIFQHLHSIANIFYYNLKETLDNLT